MSATTTNPYAAFDCLYLGTQLQERLGDCTEGELQLFSYLACLLSLFKRHPVADWRYRHASTKSGAPFSPELSDALNQLATSGLIQKTDGRFFRVTDEGIEELMLLRELSQNTEREAFLEGASSSALAIPVGIIREAVFREPELQKATLLGSSRTLLDGPGVSLLHGQFESLSEALGPDAEDMMIPSVVWLTYLSRVLDEPTADSTTTD